MAKKEGAVLDRPQTDEAIHASIQEQTFVSVQAGDIINHIVGKGWIKGDIEHKLNPDRNICARALRPFTYRTGEGAPYHNVKFRILRRWMEPRTTRVVGGDGKLIPMHFDGGDVPILDPSRPEPPMPDTGKLDATDMVSARLRGVAPKAIIGRNPELPYGDDLPVHDLARPTPLTAG